MVTKLVTLPATRWNTVLLSELVSEAVSGIGARLGSVLGSSVLGTDLGSVDLGSVLGSVLGFDLGLDREFGLGLVCSFDLRFERKCLERGITYDA